ncbi:EscU/YscU/HrcU family type III secretion system export apparatus switch protein [Amphibacillus sp. MSJ-3]|uniref:EscU/YscU/HrcU family type III secretion system export apparatus switch protein n=1 Tax=Amphibacillus sp. MSJ-3 TaxID=2841505 RepID=UPI001C0EA39D|nr:EscU/YscU/HrcU family type III secretion system export apparatus switch protein [Amphibacillus sp. MSJ-3]MBU5594945.1 EscU/YscU/HrcU family type III secretion system export apparatus switch protein [Amphibacillus sp. MSJ-3]
MNNEFQYKKAVALQYDQEKAPSPIVKAKGQGYLAEEILKRAKESGIPIQEDKSLVEVLSQLNINERIPEELYQAVAEVFAYIYKVDQSKKK